MRMPCFQRRLFTPEGTGYFCLARICHITDDFSRRRESTDLKAALAVPFF